MAEHLCPREFHSLAQITKPAQVVHQGPEACICVYNWNALFKYKMALLVYIYIYFFATIMLHIEWSLLWRSQYSFVGSFLGVLLIWTETRGLLFKSISAVVYIFAFGPLLAYLLSKILKFVSWKIIIFSVSTMAKIPYYLSLEKKMLNLWMKQIVIFWMKIVKKHMFI